LKSYGTKSWGSVKIIFPRGAAIDGSEEFSYRLVCAKLGRGWHYIHIACTPYTTNADFAEIPRLIQQESSPFASIRRILLGESVRIRFVEVGTKHPRVL
jgi:hypothetical protein